MKKLIAALLTLTLVFAVSAISLAEEPAAPELVNGVRFNMDMDQVMGLMNLPNPEIEKEKNRGTTEFWELEYEHVTGVDGFAADITFCFVGNSLVAIRYDMADGVGYEKVKADLTQEYGEAVPFDATKIGNGRYVIDDDGDLRECREMIEAEGLTIVLERDNDGDVEVTFLDPTAAYINN